MEERRQRKYEIFWDWQIIGWISSFILVIFAYKLQDAEWTHSSGGVRIVMHALAAIAAVYSIYYTFAFLVTLVTQNLIERWLLIIKLKKNKTRKILLKAERLMLKVFRPVLCAVLYIQFCFGWETLQAIEMKREIQEEQLAVDIMFAVLTAAYLLFHFSDKAAVCPYYWNKKYLEENHEANCIEFICLVPNGDIIYDFIVRRLTPFIVFGIDYFIIWSMFHIVGH